MVFGIGVTLPIFYIGSEISLSLGLRQATYAMFGGCAIVGLMMIVTSIIGARTRLSTYMIIQFSFGRGLVKFLVNPLLAMTYVGYFAATGDIFGGAIREAMLEFYGIAAPKSLCALIGCIAMSLTAMYGFRLIERFSSLAVPLLAVFLFYVVYLVLQRSDLQVLWAARGTGDMSVGLAISTVVGANILMAVSGPDLTRYAKTGWEGAKSVSGLAAGYPVIMLASGIPALVFGETDIMKIMVMLSVALPAVFILNFFHLDHQYGQFVFGGFLRWALHSGNSPTRNWPLPPASWALWAPCWASWTSSCRSSCFLGSPQRRSPAFTSPIFSC